VNGTGTVRVGIHSKQSLDINIAGEATKRVNGVITSDPDEGISIVATDRIDIAQDIIDRIEHLRDLVVAYSVDDQSSDSAIAAQAYEAEIRFLERKLEELGFQQDPNSPGFSGSGTVSELQAAEDARDGMSGRRGEYASERTGRNDDNGTRQDQNDTLTANNASLTSGNQTLNTEIDGLVVDQDALDPDSPNYQVDFDALQLQIDDKNSLIIANEATISSNESTIGANQIVIDDNGVRITELTGFITQLDVDIESIIDEIDSGTLTTEVVGGPIATFYTIGDVEAQLGNIYVEADRLTGTGNLDSPGDAEIVITNNSPNFLRLQDLVIPADDGGKLYFNSVDVNSNSDINAINGPGGGAGFSLKTAKSTGASEPKIEVKSLYDPLDSFYTSQTPPGVEILAPDIIVTAGSGPGDLTRISNTRGLVNIDSAAGSIRIEQNTAIRGARVEVKTRNGDFVQSYTNTFDHKGGDPLAYIPGDEILGTLPDIVRSPEQANSGITANGSVLIAARYLNINGTIQSGIPEWGVLIPEQATVELPNGGGAASFAEAKNHYDALSPSEIARVIDEALEEKELIGLDVCGIETFLLGREFPNGSTDRTPERLSDFVRILLGREAMYSRSGNGRGRPDNTVGGGPTTRFEAVSSIT